MRTSVKYNVIYRHRNKYSVSEMCCFLEYQEADITDMYHEVVTMTMLKEWIYLHGIYR